MTAGVNEFLTTVVLVSFIVTIVLAVGSYVIYKLRERARVPTLSPLAGPVFFERYLPPGAPDGGSRHDNSPA